MDTHKAYDVAGQMYDLMGMYTDFKVEEVHHVLSCLHRIIHKEEAKLDRAIDKAMKLNNEIDDGI